MVYQINTETGYMYAYYTNYGYYKSKGIELNLSGRLSDRIIGRLSYTFTNLHEAAYVDKNPPNRTAYTPDMGEIPFEEAQYFDKYIHPVTGGNDPYAAGYYRKHQISFLALASLPLKTDISVVSHMASGFFYKGTNSVEYSGTSDFNEGPWILRTDLKIAKRLSLVKFSEISVFAEIRNLFDKSNILAFDDSYSYTVKAWEKDSDPTGEYNMPVNREGLPYYDIARESCFGFKFTF